MHPTITGQIAAQRAAEWYQQAARQRLIRQLRAADAASPHNGRVRFSLRRFRPAAA
jgi:hypothetical protein